MQTQHEKLEQNSSNIKSNKSSDNSIQINITNIDKVIITLNSSGTIHSNSQKFKRLKIQKTT